jgi:hypothetical protein
MEIGPLKRQEYSVWVPFMDAWVLINYVPLDEYRDIIKQATRREAVQPGERPREFYDQNEADRLLGRRAVKDWKGFTDDGEEFPHTPENCDLFMAKWGEFAHFVGQKCVDIRTLGALEFPGVSCEACEEQRRVDREIPDCETERGCRIPPLGPDEARVIRLRGQMMALKDIMSPEVVFRMCGGTWEDLELLAVVEDELREKEDG